MSSRDTKLLLHRHRCEACRKALGDHGTALRLDYTQDGNAELQNLAVVYQELSGNPKAGAMIIDFITRVIKQTCMFEMNPAKAKETQAMLDTSLATLEDMTGKLARVQGTDGDLFGDEKIERARDYATNVSVALEELQQHVAMLSTKVSPDRN